MTVRQDLAAVVNNDLSYQISLTYKGRPLNLTGYTVSVVVKGSQAALDSSGTTYTVSSGLTILSGSAGRLRLQIPRARTASPGTSWYRVDVSSSNGIASALCGSLTLMAA